MNVEAFLDFSGPDDLGGDIKNAVGECALVAAAAAAVVGIATDGAGAVAAAQPAFVACMEAKGIQEADKISITFRTVGSWSDWH